MIERRSVLQAFTRFLTTHHVQASPHDSDAALRAYSNCESATLSFAWQQGITALLEALEPDQSFGLEASIVDVAQHSGAAAAELLLRPLATLELFDMALVEAQAQLIQMLPEQLRRCSRCTCIRM